MQTHHDWILLLALASGCAEAAARPSSSDAPTAVSVAEVQRESRPRVSEVVGTVRAVRAATIAPLISGTIAEMRVSLGSQVREGEPLVRLSAREAYARLEQARVASTLAERERDRAAILKKGDIISTADHEAAVSAWGMARARLAEASTVAGHAIVRAPFAGVITAKLANAGDTAMPGQALLVLEAPGALRFEAHVPDTTAEALVMGQSMTARLDGLERDLEGTLAEIQPASDDATHTRLVKVDLPAAAELRPGRFGRLLLVSSEASPSLLVPATAVVRRGQLEGVFVLEGEGARLRLVRSGRSYDGQVEIASGLSGNERVVVSRASELIDGQRVQVSP